MDAEAEKKYIPLCTNKQNINNKLLFHKPFC